jgi:hypothetical protein
MYPAISQSIREALVVDQSKVTPLQLCMFDLPNFCVGSMRNIIPDAKN